ncbi:hypothetical protein LTR36_001505 [Oleoguttula mirabilis]|uniref:Phosphatidylinositol-specific phospholipase C X domain-containing protein n=1 Tax=Oleoguttula mirabilis TaxID=1507867 RepID=A0AAV9JN39_9PEZI|nr:hypothetical protein LTR36_001505 [Oleoguttula mirabilis]
MLPRALWARQRLLRPGDRASCPDNLEKGYGTFAVSHNDRVNSRAEDVARVSSRSLVEAWMSRVDDETVLSDLTIPGTHDSAAFTYAWPFVQTQQMDILQQLNAGIRYFDLRCGIRDDIVEMVHGRAFLGLTLSIVLDTMYLWLMAHKSEGLIVQIKQDRSPEQSTVHFAQAIWRCLAKNPERWRTANTTPCLGELRGRIQLLRRFAGPALHAFGIDVTQWQDNPSRPFTIFTWHEVRITIQDHYSFPNPEALPSLVSKKGGDVAELLDRAATDPDAGHWYMNFASAYEFNFYYQLTPREIALGGWSLFTWEPGMNVRLRNYVHDLKRKRRLGIIAMDFPDSGAEDLIEVLVRTNLGPKKKPRLCWMLMVETIALLLLACLVTTGSLLYLGR